MRPVSAAIGTVVAVAAGSRGRDGLAAVSDRLWNGSGGARQGCVWNVRLGRREVERWPDVQSPGGLDENIRRDQSLAGTVCRDESVSTEDVDEPGHPTGVKADGFHGRRAEQRGTPIACHPQSVLDVGGDLPVFQPV
jgi:hypothetical protein